MKHPRDEIRLVVVLVGVCALVSGPLVSGVDFTPAADDDGSLATATGGSVTVEETTLAQADYRLVAGNYGSGIYKLRAPPARISFTEVTGPALVSYHLDVPALGYSTSTIATIDESTTTVTLQFSKATIPADSVTASSYDATARLTVRSNGTVRTVDETNVTLTVER
ncbi:hypothetical protein [Halogranum rubrum]|uniref:Uncharacterized protein n=1 Tax=Halogranum salarium B-1 TaxID=1210908 RepID=J3JE27_9EURY|nr:hypothetical protein [Halogranum salarium]EJN58001.1 hypothetical protein HSB1_34180 [Halogranum salarium B-1]